MDFIEPWTGRAWPSRARTTLTPTANLGRRGDPPPFNMLQWSNSEPATMPSHGNSRFTGTPPMNRSITMPTPSFPYGPATAMTNPTSSPPYGGHYHHHPPAHDGSSYNASTNYTHHGGLPSQYPTQASHPFNYPSAQGMSTSRIPYANLLLTEHLIFR